MTQTVEQRGVNCLCVVDRCPPARHVVSVSIDDDDEDERMMATLSTYELRGAVDTGGDSSSREPAVHVSSTGNSVVFQLRLPGGHGGGGGVGGAGAALSRCKSLDSLEIRYRRMKCAVVVMATLMITASILLVGVSLAMAEHIDELGTLRGTTRRLVRRRKFFAKCSNKKHFKKCWSHSLLRAAVTLSVTRCR